MMRGDSEANELLSGSSCHFIEEYDTAAAAIKPHYPRFTRSLNSPTMRLLKIFFRFLGLLNG
jgi:hypothetical protein